MKTLFDKIRGTIPEEFPSPRIPIWFQLSVATMLVLALSIGILSYVIMERQKDNLYNHSIELGMVSLNYIADNAKVPLLTKDTLALNTLINNIASVDSHFYAFIIDQEGTIKAHTDHAKIDKRFKPFEKVEKNYRNGTVTYFNHTVHNNTPVLNLSMPIMFQSKRLGEVHVGLSLSFIQSLFIDERAFLAYSTLIIIFLGMFMAVIFGLRFSRPISQLVRATSEITRGNYDIKVNLNRNDELGTLGEAFSNMATELFRQSMMRKSFGRYVGPEVLDMIMKSSGQSWLKGRKNEASILFADIRGFTAYSEGKEPEEVVEKLNEFFSIATEVILEHRGYVDKFVGDSVLAVFGVPVSQHDHLERSIQAAIELQKKLAQAGNNGNSLLHSIGIGIASGVVVAGNIGSQIKMEYTVIGDSVNVASYLNSIAGPGEIIIGSNEKIALYDSFAADPLEPQKIKGREGLVNIYRITNQHKN
ncbi:MAG: HAMP domain-containing protein [Desulfobulbaceae bacterium]|nr:MAG: HAMP domain-containing protein [Desulfobulbaceae bacterium]